jgi:nicotinamidase-related amidase
MNFGVRFDVARTALLALDCQTSIVSIYAKSPADFLQRAACVLEAARRAGIVVIHVQVEFRPGLPEVTARNKFFAAIKSSSRHQQLFEGTSGSISPALGPEPADLVITKRRVSAFTGTDLELVLRAKDIHTLVVFGIATSGVVLATVLQACDADYQLAVIGDCCADTDVPLHDALLERFFPQRAEVMTATDFVRAIAL